MEFDAFWLVWNENGGTPMRKHDSRESAIKEAERLAAGTGYGQKFFVLRSETMSRRSDVTTIEAKFEPPF